VVIGGGPTGVELAAEIAEFVEESREKYYSDIPKNTWHVTLVHGGENLVQGFDEYMQQKALEALQESPGITVLLKTRVKDIREGKVELENGEKLSTQTPIVTAVF
jgi:NADH dehydrogenase FAD-containing subunit